MERSRFCGALGARANPAMDLQHVLTTHRLGALEDLGGIRVEDDLDQAIAVAQVDENDPTVVPPLLHPTAEGDLLPDVPFVEPPAIVTAHATKPRVRDV